MRRIAFAMVTLVLMACSFDGDAGEGPDMTVDMTLEQVVGVWRNGERDATLTFEGNGTFQAANLPLAFFEGFGVPSASGFDAGHDRIDVHGTWTLPEKDPKVPDRHRNVLKITLEPGGVIQYREGRPSRRGGRARR